MKLNRRRLTTKALAHLTPTNIPTSWKKDRYRLQTPLRVYRSRKHKESMDTQNAGPSYVLQDHLGGMTPLLNISPQSEMSFQLTPSHSMQGVWSPGPQDMWNMMVNMQQSLMQMTDKFVAQQKDMYEQRRERHAQRG